MAGAHKIRQDGLHARQVGHLFAHVLELVLSPAAGFLAVGAIVEPYQPLRWSSRLVSTLPPAALANTPMVRFSKFFSLPLDSVHDYGSKVTLANSNSTGQAHV